jgi:tetraacyldisaccharide 4'-kinase
MRRARLLLLPFSILYWLGVVVRNWFFDIGIFKIEKVGIPVISIGNLSTGGVGKTPFVEMLIERLIVKCKLSVVSRGYGRKSTGTVVVSDGHGNIASAENSGDEPSQLAQKFPELIVVADEKRARGALKATELGTKLILIDDGFQHRYLHRDLNIVLMTAEEILDGDLLLPAGNKREPVSSLERADLIVISRCKDIKEYESVCVSGRECKLIPLNTPTIGLQTKLKSFKRVSSNEIMENKSFAGKNIIAFSGIGNPKSFEDILTKANVAVAKHIVFSDHHWYSGDDINIIVQAKKEFCADYIVTTEKDAARLAELFGKFLESESVYVAEIQQEVIVGEEVLNAAIQKIMN